MTTARRRHAGFTLIELMVGIAIAAVLMVVAVPAYRDYARNTTVSRAAASFVQAAHLARANAMRQSRSTVVGLRDTGRGWAAGWIVYTDRNNNLAYDVGTDELLQEQPPLADGVQVSLGQNASGTLRSGYLRFNPAGFPRGANNNSFSNGSISFILPDARSVRVIYTQSGRIRRCNIGPPDCPANQTTDEPS